MTEMQVAGESSAARENGLERIGLWGPRLRIIITLFALCMITLSAQRLAVFLGMRARFEEVQSKQITHGFLLGLRFDAVIAWFVTIPLMILLALIPTGAFKARWFRRTTAIYGGVILSLLIFLCVADYYFFQEFGLRLNSQVFDYSRYDAVYKAIWQQYPVVRALLAAIAVLFCTSWMFQRWALAPKDAATREWHRIWPAMLIPIAVVGIRGSLGNRPMNSGLAYFSDSSTLSQLTLNGAYTLKEAGLARQRETDADDLYPIMDEQQALRIAAQTLARPEDRFVGDADNPLRRITDTGRPTQKYNVVLVVLESMAWPYVGALDGDKRLMPNLSSIAEQGVLMDHCFAVGHRTAQGLSGTLAGFPDLPGSGVITRPQAEGCFLTLASILRQRNYETVFMQGGQPYFDHKKAFCASNGYSKIIFEDEMPHKTFRTVVGWCDEDVFDSVDQVASEMGDKPFFISMLTVSFHRPFQIPAGKITPLTPRKKNTDQLDAVRYTDRAIGLFFDKARKQKYFDNTIFVFTADHIGGFQQSPTVPGASFRIPFVVYAPKILGPARRVPTVCSQTDIAPTILSLLGGSYEHCFFGSSVLDRPTDTGVALMRTGDNELMFAGGNDDVLVLPSMGGEKRLFNLKIPSHLDTLDTAAPAGKARVDQLQTQALALLQTAEILFRRHSYNLEPKELLHDAQAKSQPSADAVRQAGYSLGAHTPAPPPSKTR